MRVSSGLAAFFKVSLLTAYFLIVDYCSLTNDQQDTPPILFVHTPELTITRWIPPRDVNHRDSISHSLEAYQRFRTENFSSDMQVDSVDIQIPSYGRILAALGEVNRSEESTADVQLSETPNQNLSNELVQLRAENERLRQELEELRNDRTLALNTSCNFLFSLPITKE